MGGGEKAGVGGIKGGGLKNRQGESMERSWFLERLWIRFLTPVVMAEKVWQTIAVGIAITSVVFASIGFLRQVGIGLGCSSAIYGIIWLLHSSVYLRRAWEKEEEIKAGVDDDERRMYLEKEVKRLRELRSLDITWVTALFVLAALLFALLEVLK